MDRASKIVPLEGTPSKGFTDLPEECEPRFGMYVSIGKDTVQRLPMYWTREDLSRYPVYRRR